MRYGTDSSEEKKPRHCRVVNSATIIEFVKETAVPPIVVKTFPAIYEASDDDCEMMTCCGHRPKDRH